MASVRLAARQDDDAKFGSTQGDHANLIPLSKSATELVHAPRMEGIEPTRNETPTNLGREEDQDDDDPKFDHTDYTVAWICPLEVEEIAALKMLDIQHQPLSQPETDHNAYTLGSINGHNVVIASLPIAGNNHAATVVTQTRNTFPHVKFGLLVGIGGGVPTTTTNGPIRLGHVVVSKPTGTHSGAVQYDHGKVEHREREGLAFKRTGFLAPPPTVLLAAARRLGVKRAVAASDPILKHLNRIDTKKANLKRFKCPGIDNDHLYKPEYVHSNPKVSCRKSGCDPTQIVDRCSDDSDDEFEEMDPSENVVVHEGTIASGEWVMKNGLQRDQWAEKDDILCFEMEAAGALADFPCLVIRGISDYADSHKNDRWQGFAAAVAAAYARELFFHMPVAEVKKLGVSEADVKKMVAGTENLVQSKLDADIKAWLSPPDPSSNYNAASARHLDGTGSWFIDSREFWRWKTSPDPSALWLYGSPGCGKTILSYAAIKELHKATECSTAKSTVLYYFFDFTDVDKQSSDGMVRSLIFQLSLKCQDAGKHLERLYKTHYCGNRKPSSRSLCTTFEAMLNDATEPMIILDALDECATRNDKPSFGGQRLLDWLGQLQCRILVTSRREADIQSSIEKWGTKTILSMQDSSVDGDIRFFVQKYLRSPHDNKLAETWELEPEVLNMIETKILSKAAGMFRWVACQLDALAEHDIRYRLFEALESLPATLTETYRRTLQRISKIHQDDTARLLQFLVYAKRPLTIKEAADALAVTPQREHVFDKDNRPRRLLEYCTSLATVSDDGKIRLAHFSVKEYFISEEDKGRFTRFLIKSEAEASITRVILAYISCFTGECDPHSHRGEWSRHWIEDRFPLAEYCARHWMDHARVAEQSNEEIRGKVFDFISRPQERPYINCCRILFDPDRPWSISYGPNPLSPLYLASLTGLRYAVERLIDEGADVNESTQTVHGSALQAASEGNHITTLELLLHRGADVNRCGGSNYSCALSTAMRNGHEKAAQLLLEGGANPDILHSSFPLHAAAKRGSMRLAQSLLEHGANVNRHFRSWTSLHSAIKAGHEDMVRLLLHHGAIVDEKAIEQANLNYRDGVVDLLLNHHSPDSCIEFLRSHTRADTERGQEIIERFLKNGNDINAVTGGRENANSYPKRDNLTVLEAEVSYGSEAGSIFLVGKGATLFRWVCAKFSLDFQSYSYQESPKSNNERLFLAACYRGWIDLIYLLCERETDSRFSQSVYDYGLQIASNWGRDNIVELLLSNQSNVNAEPGEYGDALQAASRGGHLNIVRRLLEEGAITTRVDKHGWMASLCALKYNHIDVYKELTSASNTTTLVESHDSNFSPALTFVAHEMAPNVKIHLNKCIVEAGQDCIRQLVRADHPFAPAQRKVYFEIKVLKRGAESSIGLGVCRDEVQPGQVVPGSTPYPWDSLEDRCQFFYEMESDEYSGLKIDVNDVIGCCVDYDADRLFFTRNGQYLGRAWSAPAGRLFAAISVGFGARVAFNLKATCPVQGFISLEREKTPLKDLFTGLILFLFFCASLLGFSITDDYEPPL